MWRAALIAIVLAACSGGWPATLGGSNDDQALAVANSTQHVFVAGVRNRGPDHAGTMSAQALNEDGEESWSASFQHVDHLGTDAAGIMTTVAIADGGAIFGGEFFGELDVAGDDYVSLDEPAPERRGGDLWMGRFSEVGKLMWGRQLGGTGFDSSLKLATSATMIGAAGKFHESINLGSGVLQSSDGPGTMPSYAGDVFVAMFDRDGNSIWSRQCGGPVSDTPSAIAMDGDGVTVTGSFGQYAVFGSDTLTSAGAGDGFVVRFDLNGNYQWSRQFGGAQMDAALSVASDADRSIYVAGFIQSAVDFGQGPVDLIGEQSGFVSKYDVDGNPMWSMVVGGTGRTTVTSVTLIDNRLVVGGTFDGILESSSVRASGGSDGFVAWLSPVNGAIERIEALGGSKDDGVAAVSGDPTFAFAAGYFSGDASLGDDASSSGGLDGFVARLAE